MSLKNKYVSDIDDFLGKLHSSNLELKNKQKNMRSTWWDREFLEYDAKIDDLKNVVKNTNYPYL